MNKREKAKATNLFDIARKSTENCYKYSSENLWTKKVKVALSLLKKKEILEIDVDSSGIYRYFNFNLCKDPIYIGMSESNAYQRGYQFKYQAEKYFAHFENTGNWDIKLSEAHSEKFVNLCIKNGLDPLEELHENTYVQYLQCPSDFALAFEQLCINEYRDNHDGQDPIFNVMR